MPRIQTRKVAIAQGATTYIGSVCVKHTEAKGKRNTNDGSCVECNKLKSLRWRKANPETYKQSQQKWYRANRAEQVARCKEFRETNPELIKRLQREYSKNNRPKITAKTARRVSQKLRATPAWANEFFIAEAYELSALRTKLFGFTWHVDHIVPLRSKLVCGLHCEINLQVIPAKDNMRKSNLYWPLMAETETKEKYFGY